MEEPTRILRERCDVTIHENEFGIPRDELLQVDRRSRRDHHDADRAGGRRVPRSAPGHSSTIVANHAVGFDNIDVAACTAAGVLATNTPDVLTETTADTAFALLMAAARRVGEGERFLRARTPWIWGPLMMLGQDVHHKTIGIVGFGRIGQAVARRAKGFGMRVIYSDAVQLPADVEAETGAERRELDDLLAEADFVSIHTNLTPETRHLFGRGDVHADEADGRPGEHLARSGGRRVALADALASGEIFAAGLDVFEREPEVEERLLSLENVVVIPHLGSATVDTRDAMGHVAVQNVFAALDGRASADPAEPGRSEGVIPVADREAGRAGPARGPAIPGAPPQRPAADDDARRRDRRERRRGAAWSEVETLRKAADRVPGDAHRRSSPARHGPGRGARPRASRGRDPRVHLLLPAGQPGGGAPARADLARTEPVGQAREDSIGALEVDPAAVGDLADHAGADGPPHRGEASRGGRAPVADRRAARTAGGSALGASEEQEIRRRMREEIAGLWRTDPIRPHRPEPLDEVRAVLALFDQTIFTTLPAVYREMDRRIDAVGCGARPPSFAPFLRWDTWVGGDRTATRG